MNFPPPMAYVLDMIKERFEGSENSTLYKIVKIHTRYDSSMPVVCDTEIVYNYEDLCVKLFDLDVSGWEISEGIASETHNLSIESIFNVVTIRMTRTI